MSDTIPTRVADRARWLQHNWQDFTQMLGLLPQLGDSWPAINYDYPLTASGVWLVISYTGTDQEQLRRFRRQWVRLMQSRPMPRIFLTEAQFSTEPFQLESCAADCSKYGGHYAKLRLGNHSCGKRCGIGQSENIGSMVAETWRRWYFWIVGAGSVILVG